MSLAKIKRTNQLKSILRHFTLQLAEDHILSWTDEGDLVLDPMCGSGTTCVAAKKLNRNYIGIDISKEYCELAEERIKETLF